MQAATENAVEVDERDPPLRLEEVMVVSAVRALLGAGTAAVEQEECVPFAQASRSSLPAVVIAEWVLSELSIDQTDRDPESLAAVAPRRLS